VTTLQIPERRAVMLRDSYRLFKTNDSTFLLVQLEDFQKLYPREHRFSTLPEWREMLAIADKSGVKWLPIEGKENQQGFIERLAEEANITERTIRRRITRHKIRDFPQLVFFIKASKAPDSVEEINNWNRRNEEAD
jgi:hypothetical protein